MAVAFENLATQKDNNVSSVTLAKTNTGTNLGLIVCVTIAVYSGTPPTISGVTYNGVAMTAGGAAIVNGVTSSRIFHLAAPASGTHNVVVTLSASTVYVSTSARSSQPRSQPCALTRSLKKI